MQKVQNEQIKQQARKSIQLLDQALIECRNASDIRSVIQFVIAGIGGEPLQQIQEDVVMSGTGRKYRKKTMRKRKLIKRKKKKSKKN